MVVSHVSSLPSTIPASSRGQRAGNLKSIPSAFPVLNEGSSDTASCTQFGQRRRLSLIWNVEGSEPQAERAMEDATPQDSHEVQKGMQEKKERKKG